MFEIAFRFGSYASLAIFLAALAGIVLLARLLTRFTDRRSAAVVFACFWALNLALLMAWAATVRVDSDEVEHLHVSWLVSQGLAPFRDFWQAHSPLLWYLLAPVVALFHSAAVLVFARALATALFLLIVAATGWLAWRVTADRCSAAIAALIVLALGVRLEAAWLRPDQLATLLALLSLGLCVQREAGARRNAFLAGLAFGLALSLTPKPFLAALAFPFALVVDAVTRGDSRDVAPGADSRQPTADSRFGSFLLYIAGGVVGAAPLFLLLWRDRIIADFLSWTFVQHAAQSRVEKYFPAALALAALGGCVILLSANGANRAATARERSARLLVVAAFALQSLGCVLTPYRLAVDLMLWVPLAAVLAAPLLVDWLRKAAAAASGEAEGRAAARWALLAAAFIVLVQLDAVSPLLNRRTLGDFSADRARLAWMLEQAGGRPVVLITPVHTIFSRDATHLYHLWQYSHWSDQPQIAAGLAGFTRDVLQAQPALIALAPRRITDDPEPLSANRPRLLDRLAGAGLISPAEWQALDQFLRDNYSLVEINGEAFYVTHRR